ncbi:hypothetical protein CXG81DRAFT_14204 [Caulochytrium protostelioides]|uniref:Protein SDA1 n=1 Tax=Caulochytrium protostelioides TaxID=1555241 RepID=A0A4V1IU85_9FUNG|nr:hypothetical protein CXG81DRAFT_14204 [Caulochytrium protostelioides]|eukprot:RKO99678.1 hypothetical protein CXG81DRAFT_14204 [Caulochytrium protostelioides]
MVRRSRNEILLENLPQLQNMMRRDRDSYREEFIQQYQHYQSALEMFKLDPGNDDPKFQELVNFISHVAYCYPKESAGFADDVCGLLATHATALAPDTRKALFQAVILMRNRNTLPSTTVLPLFFKLFKCKDKHLRATLAKYIITDIKTQNRPTKNNALNKTLQSYMWTVISDPDDTTAKKAAEVMMSLYRKNIWDDAKTVNILAETCFSPSMKVTATALAFFLGRDEDNADSDDEDGKSENEEELEQLRHQNMRNKKTKARAHQLERAQASLRKKQRQREMPDAVKFSALQLLNDPSDFAHKLFGRIKGSGASGKGKGSSKMPFEVRLAMIDLIGRLIGAHGLLMPNFYDYLLPYLRPHQREITSILAFCVQATHELSPPDAMEQLVQTIANHFVWNNSSDQAITAGLNTIRHICARCPLAMDETLLHGLIDDYKKFRTSGPMNAARSLITLYRDVNPLLLKKKDRGKAATLGIKEFVPKQYGHQKVQDRVDGGDLLARIEELQPDGSDADSESGSDVVSEAEAEAEADSDADSDAEADANSNGEADANSDDDAEAESDAEDAEDAESDAESDADGTEKPEAEAATSDEPKLSARERIAARKAARLARRMTAASDDAADDVEEANRGVVQITKIMAGIKNKSTYAEQRGSTTNREKSKGKSFMMMVHKRSVTGKAKASLRHKQQQLRAHIKRQKIGGKGNSN